MQVAWPVRVEMWLASFIADSGDCVCVVLPYNGGLLTGAQSGFWGVIPAFGGRAEILSSCSERTARCPGAGTVMICLGRLRGGNPW